MKKYFIFLTGLFFICPAISQTFLQNDLQFLKLKGKVKSMKMYFDSTASYFGVADASSGYNDPVYLFNELMRPDLDARHDVRSIVVKFNENSLRTAVIYDERSGFSPSFLVYNSTANGADSILIKGYSDYKASFSYGKGSCELTVNIDKDRCWKRSYKLKKKGSVGEIRIQDDPEEFSVFLIRWKKSGQPAEMTYSLNGVPTKKYFYFYSSGQDSVVARGVQDNSYITQIFKKESGRLAEMVYIDRKANSKSTSVYDEKGMLIRTSGESADGSAFKYEVTYQFDSRGNWIYRLATFNGERKVWTRREFEYY